MMIHLLSRPAQIYFSEIHEIYIIDQIQFQKTHEGKAAMELLAGIYEHWIPKEKIIQMNTWSSELAKLAANAMLGKVKYNLQSMYCSGLNTIP